MRLKAYLSQEKMSPARFGRLADQPKHRSTVRQWAEGKRFPSDPADLAWIENVTGGQVTAQDFIEHSLAVRASKVTA